MRKAQSGSRFVPHRGDRKISRAMIAAVAISLLGLSGCATVKPYSGESVDVAIEHMIHAVNEAASISAGRSKPPVDLELYEIDVALETVADKETATDFTLWIVTFGASRETEFTQGITVKLKPPKDDTKTKAKTEEDITSPHKKMVKALAKGFDIAYLAATGASEGIQRSGESALETSSVSVEISFAVSGSADAEPTITLFGVNVTSEGAGTRENVHKITMTFVPKSS